MEVEHAIDLQRHEMNSILRLIRLTNDDELVRICLQRYKLLQKQIDIYFDMYNKGVW